MELSELRKSAHLSASAINDYLDCSLLFKFGRIDRIEPEFKSDAMEFGSAIHMALAEFHQEKLTGNILTTKEFHDSFEDSWTRIAEGQDDIIKYSEGKDFNTLLLEGKELLTAYYNKFTWQQFNVLAVEEPFSFTIEGCPVPIVGAIDLIESDESDTIIITDFKTSARAYSLDEVDRNFQLTLYQMALKTNGYHDREILLRFDCLIKTKQPKFDQYYTTRSEMDEKRAIRKILEVWYGIFKGVFIPNDSAMNWRCKNCSFKKNCDEWFMEEKK